MEQPDRVLVVMPESDNAVLISETLRCAGYDVEMSNSASAALQQIRLAAYRAVLVQTPLSDLPLNTFIGQLYDSCPFKSHERPVCIVMGSCESADEDRLDVIHLSEVNNPARILRLLSWHLDVTVKGPIVQEEIMVMDMQHLREFTDGDPVLEKELADMFFENSETCLHDLERTIDDADSWRKNAHRLKGSAGNLGAQRLSQSAALAEKSAPDTALLANLRTELSSLRSFFEMQGLA